MINIGQAFSAALKRLLMQSALDEENRNTLIIVLISIFSIILVVILALLSFPSILISILFGSTVDTNPNILDDIEKVAVYQEAIFTVDELNKEWIERMKKAHSYCYEFEIEYNYDLTWHELISIDSVLLNQDFREMNQDNIIDNAFKFLVRTVNVVEREVEEEYEDIEEYEVTIIGEDGKPKTVIETKIVTKTRTVVRKIGIIKINTRRFEDVLPDFNITTEEDVFMATNIYNTISSMDVEGNLNIYDDINMDDLKEYPEGYANIPYYNQTDKRWATHPYGKSTIYSAGCGPTSLAMVVSGLTGQRVTPDVVADWSYRNGHRAEGQGSFWSLMTEGGAYYGLQVEPVSRKNPSKIVQALSEGYPVIACMGKGHFTNGGHFIVLRGLTADGKVLVYDSASVERSKAWDLSIIINESSTNGGINGSPFWIFKP